MNAPRFRFSEIEERSLRECDFERPDRSDRAAISEVRRH
jgi:hypothetical protein